MSRRRATSARVSVSLRSGIAASMSRRRRAAGRDSSKRWSSPRRLSTSAPASMPGLKSNTTALSGCPIRTASPSWAPSASSRVSTPSRFSRSARKPTASSLLKSVWRTQRSGFTPRTRQPSAVSLTLNSSLPSADAGRITIRVASATGFSRRARSTISAIAKVISRSPSPDAAEIGITRRPRSRSSSVTISPISRPSGTSILFSATRRGRSSSPPYRDSSFSMMSRSSTGFRPGSMVAVSTTCTSAAQRSMWRRKSWPRPRPSLAPSIRPGTSATVKVVSPAVTTPRFGTRVVNG